MTRHPVLRPGDMVRLGGATLTVAGLDSATARLADVTGAVFTTAVVRAARELIEHNRPYVRAGAVVGLTPLQRAVYDIIVRRTRRGNLHPFDTLPEAVRWLKQQA